MFVERRREPFPNECAFQEMTSLLKVRVQLHANDFCTSREIDFDRECHLQCTSCMTDLVTQLAVVAITAWGYGMVVITLVPGQTYITDYTAQKTISSSARR